MIGVNIIVFREDNDIKSRIEMKLDGAKLIDVSMLLVELKRAEHKVMEYIDCIEPDFEVSV